MLQWETWSLTCWWWTATVWQSLWNPQRSGWRHFTAHFGFYYWPGFNQTYHRGLNQVNFLWALYPRCCTECVPLTLCNGMTGSRARVFPDNDAWWFEADDLARSYIGAEFASLSFGTQINCTPNTQAFSGLFQIAARGFILFILFILQVVFVCFENYNQQHSGTNAVSLIQSLFKCP